MLIGSRVRRRGLMRAEAGSFASNGNLEPARRSITSIACETTPFCSSERISTEALKIVQDIHVDTCARVKVDHGELRNQVRRLCRKSTARGSDRSRSGTSSMLSCEGSTWDGIRDNAPFGRALCRPRWRIREYNRRTLSTEVKTILEVFLESWATMIRWYMENRIWSASVRITRKQITATYLVIDEPLGGPRQ
jgi:hypothetical protein